MSRTVSFPDFAGLWSPLVAARSLRAKAPLAVTYDGVPVVLFRDGDGRARALVDRCPHRSVKLSLGRRTAEGELQCAFHGWRFDGEGRCRHLPLSADARPEAAGAQALACREVGGLVWVCAASEADAPPLHPPAPLVEAGWHGTVVIRDWDAHWSRALQTMLDVAHIPVVHPRSIGTAFGRAMGGGDAKLSFVTRREENKGFHADWRLENPDTGRGDAGWLAFLPPNAMTLGIPQKAAGRTSMLYIWCVPLTAETSRMVVVSRRNFGRYAVVPRLYDLLTPVILGEDKRNVEGAWPSEVPAAGQEVSTAADAPTVAFQRWYRARFRPSAGEREAEAA